MALLSTSVKRIWRDTSVYDAVRMEGYIRPRWSMRRQYYPKLVKVHNLLFYVTNSRLVSEPRVEIRSTCGLQPLEQRPPSALQIV